METLLVPLIIESDPEGAAISKFNMRFDVAADFRQHFIVSCDQPAIATTHRDDFLPIDVRTIRQSARVPG